MKVSKCCENETKNKPVTLTWAEILKQEGIYKPVDFERARLIVLSIQTPGLLGMALFYDSVTNTLVPAFSHWAHCTFIRTNETICFGLKAG